MLLADLRYAARSFARAKTATAVLVLSLAFGTGANAALYGLVDALLFRAPEAIAEAPRLASVHTSQFNGSARGFSSFPDYQDLRSGGSAFESLAAFDDSRFEMVRLPSAAQRVRVVAATGNFFDTLGLRAHEGRLLTPGDSAASAAVAVISDSFWTAIGRNSDAIGQRAQIGGREYTIVGIAPPRFNGLQLGRSSDVWIPLDEAATGGRGDRRLSMIGRLARTASVDDARAAVQTFSASLAERYPDTNRGTRNNVDEPRVMTVEPYSRLDPSERERVILTAVAVFGATGLLLLSACINTAAMLVSRSAARRRELAVKLALGASRRLLARQTVVESLFICLAGASLGLFVAYWTSGLLPALFAPEEAEMLDTQLDPAVIATAIVLSCLAGVAFAIAPARQAMQTLDVEVLRADAGGVTDRRGAFVRTVVVIGQVALSTMMLIGAGLLVHTLSVALEGELGSASRGVAIAVAKMPGIEQEDALRGILFRARTLDAVRKMPGTEAVAWVATMPPFRSGFQVFDIEAGPGLKETVEVDVNVASSDYFRTMKIPVIEGRPFTADDTARAKPVVVVNDVLARRHVGERAVGAFLTDGEGVIHQIVGVVRSGKYRTFQEAPEPTVYFPVTQRDQGYMHLVVRTSRPAETILPAIKDVMVSIDEGVDVRLAVTLDEYLLQALTLDRLVTTIVATCGAVALFLATIGVYGVIADSVRRRTPEIGLRVALGANPLQVVRLVFSEGLYLTTAGAGVGVLGALVVARVTRAFVTTVPPVDTISLAVAPLALIVVVLGAAALPTRHALRISPTIALRAE
jgi:predicted permease